jgi:cell wall-associated NlpC family hydrolase
VLASINKIETDFGTNLNVSSAGAVGWMQFLPSSWETYGLDANGDGRKDPYNPVDAICAAAHYLKVAGGTKDLYNAILSYNHADWYVQEVLSWASTYATGGFTVASVTTNGGAAGGAGTGQSCTQNSVLASFVAPNAAVQTAVNYAEQQLGKPYLFGGTGPAAYDCSGLVMMAYQAANITIPRTSQDQWALLPHVAASKVLPGDLVFFAGGDGTVAHPGHVGLVIGKNKMIEAYATGTPIRISSFGTPQSAPGDTQVVGFAQPWPNAASKKSGNAVAVSG